jgi:hypothetical protein
METFSEHSSCINRYPEKKGQRAGAEAGDDDQCDPGEVILLF